ncbi:MAG: hypothetical protein DCC75_00805 [Proteobacteria bacterium]|nr:MAG: hypothetical protein DCC75_00805 [Pseudomonadota bacterium]
MGSEINDRSALLAALRALILPLARFCIRNSLSIQDFYNQTKLAFLQAGEEEISRAGKKINVSRLSVVTGMYRGEVQKIYREKEIPTDEPANVLGRVLGQWNHNRKFCGKNGQPRVLSFRGENSEFKALCSKVSKTINPGTVLFELERRGLAKRTPRGLKHARRMINLREDPKKTYSRLGHEFDGYLKAVEENIKPDNKLDNLHIHTEYDNIFERDVPKIKSWLVQQGRFFHRKVRKFLSKYDRDFSPDRAGSSEQSGVRVQVGTFSLTVPASHKTEQS